ncbi:MAG: hypothetical protein K8T25_24965 [Planctomycetia bacterium]|nr:hypothetical protein [Planctomycetia bacterium]
MTLPKRPDLFSFGGSDAPSPKRSRPVDPKIEDFERRLEKVKRIANALGCIGLVAGLTFFGSAWYFERDVELDEVFPLTCGMVLYWMTMGGALLFAPSEYLSSLHGRKYLKLVGTTRPTTTRVVLALGLVAGVAFFFMFSLAAMQWMGYLAPPRRA